jgi:hypothetical protein
MTAWVSPATLVACLGFAVVAARADDPSRPRMPPATEINPFHSAPAYYYPFGFEPKSGTYIYYNRIYFGTQVYRYPANPAIGRTHGYRPPFTGGTR